MTEDIRRRTDQLDELMDRFERIMSGEYPYPDVDREQRVQMAAWCGDAAARLHVAIIDLRFLIGDGRPF